MKDVALCCCVRGEIFERYFAELAAGALEHFLPERTRLYKLPCNPGWPWASTSRYQVILEHEAEIEGEWIFNIDADMRVEGPVGEEILSESEGLIVTTHPGFPPGTPRELLPYEQRPDSWAFVPPHKGERYYPGAFVGGRRESFLHYAEWIMVASNNDRTRGVEPVWNDESYLNRYLLSDPPTLVLDERYCYWDSWGPDPARRLIVHLDKSEAEFDERVLG